MKLFRRTKDIDFSWGCGHVHPCCCLRFSKQTTAPFVDTFSRAVASARSKVTRNALLYFKRNQNPQLSRRRRCRPEAVARPYHDRDRMKKRPHRSVLRDAAVVVVQLHDGSWMVASRVQYLSVSTRSPFQWTCDRAWDKGDTTSQRRVGPLSLRLLPQRAAHCKRIQACNRLLIDVILACPRRAASCDVS